MLGQVLRTGVQAFQLFAKSSSGELSVVELSSKQMAEFSQVRADCWGGELMLCSSKTSKMTTYYVIHAKAAKDAQTKRYYRIYCTSSESSASECFVRVSNRQFVLLFQIIESEDMLKKMVQLLQEHKLWEPVHFASAVGLTSFFEAVSSDNANDRRCLEVPCQPEGKHPLHLALEEKQISTVKMLLNHATSVSATDANGANAFHYAALKEPLFIEMLASAVDSSDAIDKFNAAGYSPLGLALSSGNLETVEALLMAGAKPVSKSHLSALEEAMGYRNEEIAKKGVKLLLKYHPCLVCQRCPTTGNSVLHNRVDKDVLSELLCLTEGCLIDINVRNAEGQTALHLCAIRKDLGCLLRLLSYGADPNCVDNLGSSSLIYSVLNPNIHILRALIVFGADVSIRNAAGCTARDLVSMDTHMTGKEREAFRCTLDTVLFQAGPEPSTACGSPTPSIKTALNELALTMAASHVRSAKSPGVDKQKFVNLLALDGGGIRGLILIQILLFIEGLLQQPPLFKKFDWVVGTSTGGILSIALCQGKSLRQCQQLYFRFKDRIFSGGRPYDTTVLEQFLKNEFGSSSSMADIKQPNLIVTSVIADKHPMQLKLFRNYQLPLSNAENSELGYADPRDQMLWRVARCTSAAPTFFTVMDGKYVDGGLMSNNPALDALVDMDTVNTCWKYCDKEEKCFKVGCVLSIGTGRNPGTNINNLDKLHGSFFCNPIDALLKAFAIKDLGNMFIDQLTATDGCPVARTRAYCSAANIPFFRFSTALSFPVELDTKEDIACINMLWETIVYMQSQRREVDVLCDLLRS